ncbi:MAG: hypothetical protein ABH956_03360 [Candidatus Nealsonbacteria bacterium]
MSKSVKKYIRKEKSRIRREFLTLKEQEEMISKLYRKIKSKPVIGKKKPIQEISSKNIKVGNDKKEAKKEVKKVVDKKSVKKRKVEKTEKKEKETKKTKK